MSDKILYTGGPNPFKGLIGGLPEEPNNDEQIPDWKMICKEIKSNAPDIVNPEVLGITHYPDGTNRIYMGEGHGKNVIEFVAGDIFDLPVGYSFEKGKIVTTGCLSVDVLRIVKTEVKDRHPLEYNIWSAAVTWCEICKKHFYPADKNQSYHEVSQPEPEESQKELWEDAQKEVHEFIIKEHAAGRATGRIAEFEYLQKYFTIQRKK